MFATAIAKDEPDLELLYSTCIRYMESQSSLFQLGFLLQNQYILGEISAGTNHCSSRDMFEKTYLPLCLALTVKHLATVFASAEFT